MSDPIITFDHVVKEFKTRGRGANIARAVDDVSLTIDRGDIFGIIGYSGAGMDSGCCSGCGASVTGRLCSVSSA